MTYISGLKIKLCRAFALALVIVTAFSATSCTPLDAKRDGLSTLPSVPSETPLVAHIDHPASGIRGVWVASAYNLDFPSKPDLSQNELIGEIDAIVENAALCNLNAIFLQVRPSADALYDSDVFPISKYLYTKSGSFDPLEYFVYRAHSQGIALHAWINPMRVSSSALTSVSKAPHREYTVSASNGGVYYDIGIPAARELIADGVEEIVEKYDVDGIVFDDYFYPYPEDGRAVTFGDSASYKSYGAGKNIADFRRSNVNSLIKLCYERVKSVDERCLFGVSPFGIWKNDDGENGGSATAGLQAYDAIYCDALAWARGGYVDYVAPQIYWSNETAAAPFDVLCRWWDEALSEYDVGLVISHGVHKYADGSFDAGEVGRQIELSEKALGFAGSLVYGYSELVASDSFMRESVDAFATDLGYNALVGCETVRIDLASGSGVSSDRVYISGKTTAPRQFSIVGAERMLVTDKGYFTAALRLDTVGKNTFVIRSGDESCEYVLSRLE